MSLRVWPEQIRLTQKLFNTMQRIPEDRFRRWNRDVWMLCWGCIRCQSKDVHWVVGPVSLELREAGENSAGAQAV